MKFNDKVVLITGASRGIGRATAEAFAAEGAKVIINYNKNEEEARKTYSLLRKGDHMIARADVSNPSALEKMFDDVIGKYGQLDILINNAGIGIFHPIDDVSFGEWQSAWNAIMKTNLTAVANTCFLAAEQMRKQNSGRIVNVSSRGAFRGEPKQPAYGASKAGMNSLSQSLAKQLGKYNIFVAVVAPGFVETDMAVEFLSEEENQSILVDSPLKRMAKPEEVAAAILYLASDEAAYSTGAILDINGASYLRS